ncbi:MAG: hypothetical protein ACE5HO_14040 [bacterium]
MNTTNLTKASSPIKLLSTLFMLGIGISYFFGLLMVVTWVGLTPNKVTQTLSKQPGPSEAVGQESTVTEEPINLNEEIEVPHLIDRNLLVQDTHVHLPVYSLIAVVLALIAAGIELKTSIKMWLIAFLFLGGWLDFLGMWGVKYLAAGFAYVTLAGGWIMFVSWLLVAVLAMRQMWF